jgi:hypothetical protein
MDIPYEFVLPGGPTSKSSGVSHETFEQREPAGESASESPSTSGQPIPVGLIWSEGELLSQEASCDSTTTPEGERTGAGGEAGDALSSTLLEELTSGTTEVTPAP